MAKAKLSKTELRRGWEMERGKERRIFLRSLAVTFAVFLLCLCFRYNAYNFEDKFVPLQYFKSYLHALRVLFGGAAVPSGDAERIVYLGALSRLRQTLMAFVSGAGLALAGAVFQTSYRNPMASPNILGATAGVRLGNVLVISLYSAAAVEHIYLRYACCYGFTAVCVLFVLLLGKLAGDRRENYSVLEMVMAGSVLSQTLNVVTMYVMYHLQDEDLLLYEEISFGMFEQTDALSTAVFFAVMLVSILPVLLLRYRLNAIGIDRLESAALGIKTGPLRLTAQVCGVLMVTCAMIHCGEMGMAALVLPHAVRHYAGADFRMVCVYSILSGGVLMMAARLLGSFFLILSEPVPIAFIVNLILMPAFVVILARQRGHIS